MAKFLQDEIFEPRGCPERLLNDNKSPYGGSIMQEECTWWGINHCIAVLYHLEANGLDERTTGTLKRMMECLADGSGAKCREYLGLAVIAYCLMPHSETGSIPF